MSSLGIFDEHIASLEKMRKKQTSSIKPRDLGDMSERLFHQRVFRAGPQAGQADLDRDCLKVCLGSWVVTEFLILMGFAVPYFNTLCVAHCLKADHVIYFFLPGCFKAQFKDPVVGRWASAWSFETGAPKL